MLPPSPVCLTEDDEDDALDKFYSLVDDFNITYYLGGSRGMASRYPTAINISPSTDYDFNIQHGYRTADRLRWAGFTEMEGNPEYKDDQACLFFKQGLVTVVTRKNLSVYIKAFEMMPLDLYRKLHWKSSPCLTRPFCKIATKEYFNSLFREVIR